MEAGMKQTLKFIFAMILVALLTACRVATPLPTAVATVTALPSLIVSSATALLPTPTPTASPPPFTATPDYSPPVSSAPDDVQMAYTIGGHLYFQDGSKPSRQLTHGPAAGIPIAFSEDGQQIFFERSYGEIYSIHVDGSQEQVLVPLSLLDTLGPEYKEEITTFCHPVLIPHKNVLLFRTCTYPSQNMIIYQDDLFSVDADTKQVKTLFPRGKGGGYHVSPDGEMLAIERLGSIDLHGIDGRLIRRKLATYIVSEPIPVGAEVHWLSDSSGLVLALPINTFYDTAPPPTYEIWRYSLKTGRGTLIELNPPVMGHAQIPVSSDGNWITYINHEEGSFYLGDLRQGNTQSYEVFAYPDEWSPDNEHFVYNPSVVGSPGLYLGSTDAPPILIGCGEFVRWLDARRYICYSFAGDVGAYVMGEIGREPVTILSGNVWHLNSYGSIIFRYRPSSE
jgi:hypothetical protein